MMWIIVFIFLNVLAVGGFIGCAGYQKTEYAPQGADGENADGIDLPNIGQLITTEKALALCRHFGFQHIVARIENNPEQFKEWAFDGCSMAPDGMLSEIIDVPTLTEICLRHDLEYAYGVPGDKATRLAVDETFQKELLQGGAGKLSAATMFKAVRMGGYERYCLSYTWGFARTAPCQHGVGFIAGQ